MSLMQVVANPNISMVIMIWINNSEINHFYIRNHIQEL
jgi:hypothetical protein